MIPAPHADLLAGTRIVEGRLPLVGSITRYWEYGPEDAEHVIVAVHGYRGEHHGLEPIVARLPGIRIISPDLPGFGESSEMTKAPHSVEGYGIWLEAFVGALGLTGTAILLGHSFGSIVVAHAVADGLATPAVVLVNPIAGDPRRVTGIGATRFFYRVADRLPPRAARAWLGNPVVVRGMSTALATTRDRRLRRWIHGQHHAYFSRFASTASVAEGFRASLSADVCDVADQLTMPVLLVAGERDRIAPLADQFTLLDLLPDGRLDVIPGVGHLIHYETPDAAAHAIRSFIDDLA